MGFATSGGVRIYTEDTGKGEPVIFAHGLANDVRSWEAQVRAMTRRYRCITYNARGFPPSDVPADPAAYSQDLATDDLVAVLAHRGIAKAHLVGFSMGGYTVLNVAIRYPERVRSVVAVGVGFGSLRKDRAEYRGAIEERARQWADGIGPHAEAYAREPDGVQYRTKDPRGWAESVAQFAQQSGRGVSLTLLGVQRDRPTVYELEDGLRGIRAPVLILTGDEDNPSLEPSLFLKRIIPRSGLWIFPWSGHPIGLEEPDLFNDACLDFFAQVKAGRWGKRDPRAVIGGAL